MRRTPSGLAARARSWYALHKPSRFSWQCYPPPPDWIMPCLGYTWLGVYAFGYCPDCGAVLDPLEDSAERFVSQACSACGAVHYRNAKPCAGAPVVLDGQVLLGRCAVEPAIGCWDIPGGFLNPWEHPADCAVREVREETGLEVRPQRLLDVVIDTYHEQHFTLSLYWIADVIVGEERPGDDLSELRWFGCNDLPTAFAFPHCARVLQAW